MPSGASPATEAARRALNRLSSAAPGQITAREARDLADTLRRRDAATAETLRAGLQSPDGFERLLAFRLLLDAEGWTPQLRDVALRDSLVLVRSEAATWLYLQQRFTEWDEFLSAAAAMGGRDYEAIKPYLGLATLWPDLPAGLDMLGIGRGLDRYVVEMLRREAATAAATRRELTGGGLETNAGLHLLRLMHDANPPNYWATLTDFARSSSEDTPLRYEALWRLGQDFPQISTRDILKECLSAAPRDPLRTRIAEVLDELAKQVLPGASRLEVLEAQLSVALDEGNRAQGASALVEVLREGLRNPAAVDRTLLQRAGEQFSFQGLDGPSRRRAADLGFLRRRQP